jgi:hypothetical protein
LGPLCYFEVDRLTKHSYNERKHEIIAQKKKNARLKHKKHEQFFLQFSQDAMEIEDKIHVYLKNHTTVKRQTKEHVNNFMQALEEFDLTMPEKMHLLNLAPTTLVEIHLIIDRCSQKFQEHQTIDLLAIVKEHLLNEPPPRIDKRKGNFKGKGRAKGQQKQQQPTENVDDMMVAMQAAL